MLNKLISNPKKLFLNDSFGALLTAFFLGVILASFESTFGMPRRVLYGLSFIACLYAIYSFLCYWFLTENWRPYLIIIAIANALYACLTIGLVFYFYQSLTALGLAYFFGEIMIMCGVIFIEFKAISKLAERKDYT